MSLPSYGAGHAGTVLAAEPHDGASSAHGIERKRWRTTTFRWFAAYAAIFAVSFTVLLGFIGYSATRAMLRETDSGLRWQLRYFDYWSDSGLPAAIANRLEHQTHYANYYGLFAPDGHRIAGNISTLPPSLLLGHSGRSHDSSNGQTLLFEAAGRQMQLRAMGEVRADGSRLVVARPLSDVRHVHDDLDRALIVGGLICLVASLVAGLLLSMRQMRRVSEIRRVTDRIASGDLAQRLPVNGRDELDMLSHLVNRMLDEVERLMAEVKGACDGIAHDLRTPLGRLRLRLSNAAENLQRSGDAQTASVLLGARDDADAVLARFTALLRISEIGAMQRRSSFSNVSPAGLLGEVCDLYAPLAEEKQIELSADLPDLDPIWADRELLFEAFSNLVDNAIKFAPVGGRVGVTLRGLTQGPQVVVSDNGPGIAPHERTAVLDRFYRAERTRHVPGTGLGLGIVTAIVRLHDFELRIGGGSEGAIITVDCWPHHP